MLSSALFAAWKGIKAAIAASSIAAYTTHSPLPHTLRITPPELNTAPIISSNQSDHILTEQPTKKLKKILAAYKKNPVSEKVYEPNFADSSFLGTDSTASLRSLLAELKKPTTNMPTIHTPSTSPFLTKKIKPINNPFSLSVSNKAGSITFQPTYSSQYQWIFSGGISTLISSQNALGVKFDLGEKQRRLNLSFANFTNSYFSVKFTGEVLQQKQRFAFESGNVSQFVSQIGFGASIATFSTNIIKGLLEIEGYYKKTLDQTLGLSSRIESGDLIQNYRHISGGKSYGGSLLLSFNPFKNTLVTLGGNFDKLTFSPIYQTAKSQNKIAFGASIDIKTRPISALEFHFLAGTRVENNNFSASITWHLPLITPTTQNNIVLGGEYISSNTSSFEEDRFYLRYQLTWGQAPSATYTYLSAQHPDLLAWTNKPIFYSRQVEASVDESTVITPFAPNITNILPSSGLTSGGTSVTISGSGFTGVTSVTFDGVSATSINVVNDTTITANTPAHSAGAVDVVISGPGNSDTLSNGFTYQLPPPDTTNISPIFGSTAGGTSITISGSGFTGVTSVTFDGVSATSINVVNDTTITANTPAHSAGAVDVVVTGPSGSDTLSNAYTYYAPPDLISLNPTSGPLVGGTFVTLTGTGFTGTTGVTFGLLAATNVTIVNDTTITCNTPLGVLGATNVTVTNLVGNDTLTSGYTYTLF